ncbi:MAG: M48 family metallopeptidase [Reyranella sp.]|uniref:M48 family metallopeptidase n=1 Tax=Reyranella sp. TaxID=1929291 RepID=UPI003D116E16
MADSGPAPRARFYDGVTALVHGADVRATASDLVIVRRADSFVLARWPIADVFVLGDVEHEGVPAVACKGSDARLVADDLELRRQLAQLIPHLARLTTTPAASGARIASFGATLVALLGVFWFAVDYGSEYAAPLLPHSLQARLGESVYDEITADKEECHGKAGLAAINGLANRLAQAAGYEHPITVHVIAGGPVNAFTLPGGILVFFYDLIDQAKDSSQVAGVLAHEIGHVVHHHPTKGLVRQFGIDLMLKLVSGGYSDVIGTLGSGGSLLLALRNGRAFEREADATGVSLLEKLGIRADGIASFFEQMIKKESTDMAAAAGIWSSHPPTAERIAATKRLPVGRPAFTDAEWRALRNVCR